MSDLIDNTKKTVESNDRLHFSSCSSGTLQINQKPMNKASFNFEEIKRNIQETESRRLEREKEIDEICNLNSCDEQESPYIKNIAETTTTMPSTRENEEEKEYKKAIWFLCCKKCCRVM